MDDKKWLQLLEEMAPKTPAQVVDTILGGISPVINTQLQVSNVMATGNIMTYTLSRHDGAIAGYAHYRASTGAVFGYETPDGTAVENSTPLYADIERAVQSYLEWR